jgi:hypothetical protein
VPNIDPLDTKLIKHLGCRSVRAPHADLQNGARLDKSAGDRRSRSGDLLPKSASDVDIALRAQEFGLAPRPMSVWCMKTPQRQGLLLCVTNLNERRLPADCRQLLELAR